MSPTLATFPAAANRPLMHAYGRLNADLRTPRQVPKSLSNTGCQVPAVPKPRAAVSGRPRPADLPLGIRLFQGASAVFRDSQT